MFQPNLVDHSNYKAYDRYTLIEQSNILLKIKAIRLCLVTLIEQSVIVICENYVMTIEQCKELFT